MSSSNPVPIVYHSRKTQGRTQGEIPTAGRPSSRPTTRAPRKGQEKALSALDKAAAGKSGSIAPPTGIVKLGSAARAAASKAKDQPRTSNKLDLSTVQAGQLLWHRLEGPPPLWIPAKVSKVNIHEQRRSDSAVTLFLAHQSQMVTVSQSDIDNGAKPVLEAFEACHRSRMDALKNRASPESGRFGEVARLGLEKLNGDWRASGRSNALSALAGGGLAYKLSSSVSSITQSPAKIKPMSHTKSESDLSDIDCSDDDFQGASNQKSRKRASSPSASASASSSSAPAKKARTEPPKPETGITTITFTRRAARPPIPTSNSTSDPRPMTNFSQDSILDSILSQDYVPPVVSGFESDSDMDIPGVGPSAPRHSHLELSVPIGISILAHRSDSELGSRFAPARVIGYAPNDQLHVRFYDGQEHDHLPRTEMVIMGDAEFGSANVETIPDPPPVPRGYRNPVLEARLKAVFLGALDDIVCGNRTCARVALYNKSVSVRAVDRRAAETELAGRLGGEPFSKPEIKLIRRALEARYVLGVPGLAEEPEEVLMSSQCDELDMPSSSQGRRGAVAKGKGKAKGGAANAKAGKAVAAPLQVSPDRQRRSRKGVTTYAESSSDSELEFVKEQDAGGNIVTGGPATPDHPQLAMPHVLAESEVAAAPSLESTFPAPPSTLPRKEQRFVDLVLFPECLARLLILTHLTDTRTGEIANTGIRTAGGAIDNMKVDELITLGSSSSTLSSSQPHAPAPTTSGNPSVPEWHLRAMKRFKLNSDHFNDPRTWRDVPAVTVQYGLSAEEEAQVLPMAEELLRDCHWMQALLLLKRSNSGKGHGRSRR
ncbi:hypothetical protein BCR44DRAFT_1423667 [Catenaria anguillulae PL171]|uniref:PWWP domain-containing protein n=1 Tax=Catenaria anguillulae PL171 TaxID=765915 RepID=A0A1Y2I1K0_9FUNG|nr:hypothetical protein BCR44DRAFT_1423667 [Catenaria anguillulae PL171]